MTSERQTADSHRYARQGAEEIGIERIDGAVDPRVASYRDIGEPRLVGERGLFVAEGRLVVARAIAARRFTFESLLLSPAALRQLSPAIETLPPGVPVYVCDPSAFAGITGYNIHRGCLALVERPPAVSAAVLLRDARVLVVAEAIANPDNIGGIFRNAAAFGASGVLLDGASCDPLYRKAIRTSMAATLSVPFARLEPWPDALDAVRRAGFTVAALTPREDAEAIRGFAARTRGSRIALALGAEGAGLSDAAFGYADARVRIEIDPAVDSLNVAVAAGIALHEVAMSGWVDG